MKNRFNSAKIWKHNPTPKVNQIWETKTGELLKIIKITKKDIQAMVENQAGEKHMVGFAWFDSNDDKSHTFIGKID